jgi:hypothetical protein
MTKPISVLYKYKGWGGGHDQHTPYMSPRITLAIATSRPNSEALATCLVLAHQRATFHPCMCGLRGGVAVVVATLIGCDNVEVAAGMTTRKRRS